MKKYTDEEVWSLCLSGKTEAFEELYMRFYPLLYNYGFRVIPDTELIRDIIHELFLKLLTNRKAISGISSVKGYLLRAFRNKLYDILDKQKRKSDFHSYPELSVLAEENKDEPDEEIRIMMESYERLSDRQKEIIYLYYIQNLSHSEIAAIMDINYQSSKNLLNRSIVALRSLFMKKMEKLQL